MTPAERVLQRLLLLLPIAHEDRVAEGMPIDALAEDLGVEPSRILRDIEELDTRNYYLPAALGSQIQLRLTSERVTVWTSGEFDRPVRLTPREAMALELGLRILVRRNGASDLEALRNRLLRPLRTPVAGEDGADDARDPASAPPKTGAADASGDPAIRLADLEARDDPIRMTVYNAVEVRRVLQITYRALARDPSTREVAPLLLAHAESHWYLLARDLGDEIVRAFRLDRILAAAPTHASFDPMESDDVAVERFLRDGRVHDGGAGARAAGDSTPTHAGQALETVVEYSPAIARWIRERSWGATEEVAGGGLRVRHVVYDPEWLVRHVLGYGADAWVVEPDSMRERVVEAARRLAADPTP